MRIANVESVIVRLPFDTGDAVKESRGSRTPGRR
jgi:hypothetical protein